MVLSPSSKAGLAALLLLIATPAIGMEEQEPLSSEIKKVTGDWVAEEWDDGEIKFHPDAFTWQSDIHLTVRAAEPALGRSAMDVARAHFDGYELDDDTLEPTVVNMADAKDMGEGILMKSYGWAYAFDSNFSQFGVVQRKDGSFIPFHGNCLVDDERYSEDQCLRAMMTILFALRGVDNLNVAMPDPPAPISVPYWSATYDSSGTTILSNRNFHGTVTATVMVSPPVEIPEAMLNARIEAYTDNLVDDFDEQIDKDPGTRQWVGSKDDPWFRRDFPEAFSGPSTIMAGTEKTPDGKVVLIGVRCPNPGWQGSCARAVSMSRQQVASGQAEQRRTGIISQTWGGFPTGGLKNADVEMVYLKGEGSSATGFYTLDFDAIMLMRDGTACKCFDRALGQIVPSESKAEDPDSWGRWAQKDGVITVIWPPMEMEVLDPSEVTKMAGGDAQTRIQGNYTHTSAGGMVAMGTSYINQSFFEFSADGTFSSDRSNSYQVTAGSTANPDAYVAGGSSGAGPRGTYEIDGYNMKMTYPDGRIQWMGFAQAADEAASPVKTQLWLDGTYYYNDDD